MGKKLSFKFKLLTNIVGISLVALVLFEIMANNSKKALISGKQSLVKAAAEGWIDKIDRNLFERYGDVQAFALSEPARSGNPARMGLFINDMMTTYAPIYDLMLVTNAKGVVVAINGVDKTGKNIDSSFMIGKDLSSAPWFKAAISGEVKPGTAFVEDLHVDQDVARIFTSSGKVMNFSAPIRDKDSGQILGVWSNRMSWTDVVDAITKEELAKVKSDRIKQAFAYIVDINGKYLLHPEGEKMELKQSKKDFENLKAQALKESVILEEKIQSQDFDGDVYQAMTHSKGYASYPGKGWFAMIDVPASDDQEAFNRYLILFAFVAMGIGILIAFFFVTRSTKTLDKIISDLSSESGNVRNASGDITSASQKLAQATTEQASALQETAASIEEMNAMIKKSAESANRSRDVATVSHDVANKGKASVDEMVHAIEDINQSNGMIMQEVEASNKQITEIVKVITEIGNKTKVINDIVFQTKLLSFNASVEAARAGEHGKGFAVVAEEVGNLAQMSGNAAKEISDMLNGSIHKVESIVNSTKEKVERLIAEGRGKVEAGASIARVCGDVLEEVVKNVSELNLMVGEISTAAHEQAQGINEITKAMNQLDQVTHENAATSQEAATSAQQLDGQALSLQGVVTTLKGLVHGSNNAQMPTHTPAAPSVSNVAQFQGRPKAPSAPSTSVFKHKKAAGAEHIPSENDPRFKDV